MPSRLRSRLIWRDEPKAVSAKGRFSATGAHPAADEKPGFDIPVAPREQAIGLLRIGAEIEHALMAQYLYAAYSLNEEQPDQAKRALVQRWKAMVLEIAREEMGHLATVENLLTLIGGPLCFDREDFPIIDPELWPFPFQLERLTKVSLGKYVLAEMPAEEVLVGLGLKAEIDAIKKKVHCEGDVKVHRVGLIYEDIRKYFVTGPMPEGPAMPPFTDTHPFIATVDIQTDSVKYQVTPSAWGLGYKDILIETAQDRNSAQAAIDFISVQGEGSTIGDLYTSHFGKFLNIYREFPDESDWQASRNVATNPTTNPQICDPTRYIEGEAADWGDLCNLRYRMLLMYLQHSFVIEAPADFPSRSPRGALVSWTFGEMYNIRSVSEILMGMPLRPGSAIQAGPPFEMPYSLAMATRNPDRWRGHRDLLMASITLTKCMLPANERHGKYLRALLTADETALQQITALIGA